MAKKKGLRFFSRSIFDVPRWIGWQSLKNNAGSISRMYHSLIRMPEKSNFSESYEEAIIRMNLSKEDLERSQAHYRKTANFYFTLFLCGLGYHFYLIFNHYWVSAFVMISFDLMLFSFWFKESFWLMQITKKQLGLSFKDWLCHIFDI